MKQRDKQKLTKTIFKTDHSQIGQRNKYMSTRVILLRSVRGKPTIGEYVHTSYIHYRILLDSLRESPDHYSTIPKWGKIPKLTECKIK